MTQSNTAFLTYGSNVFEVKQMYYSPSALIPPFNNPAAALYLFIGGVEPWADEANPPVPTQDQKSIKNIQKNIIALKQITSNDISPVIPRIDWSTNTVYTHYQDNIDMFSGNLNFYVRNSYDQVFKCLWNNNGGLSTFEPVFEPGIFNSNEIYQNVDGYKWVYMYTIDQGSKQKFFDIEWMPVISTDSAPNPLATTAGIGNIPVINMINTGSGYDTTNAVISVAITGDGLYANALPIVANGQIIDMSVTVSGNNYSYANVTITSALGSNAQAVAYASPVGGHGFDPISELGCNTVMVTCQINQNESGIFPTDIQYRQIGLLLNPVANSTYPNLANSSSYSATSSVVVSNGSNYFNSGEIVYQGPVGNPTFTATCIDFNSTTNVILLLNTQGNYTIGNPIFGSTTGTSRTLLQLNIPDIITNSGYVTYIENRIAIQRSSDGSEQFRLAIGF